MTSMYVDVTDIRGGTHRLLFENNEVYGHENLMMQDPRTQERANEFSFLVRRIMQNPLSGQLGNFIWKSVS